MKLKRILLKTTGELFVKLRKRPRFFIAVLLAFIVITSVIIAAFPSWNDKSGPKSYQENVSGLIADIQTLSKSLGVPEGEELNQLSQDLDNYQKQLANIQSTCQQLVRLKQPNNSDKGRAIGERTRGICQDILLVSGYSSRLHEHLRDYLLLPAAAWPKAGSPQFMERLDETAKVLTKTHSSLESLDNSKVQDPALDELLYQIKFAQDIAQKVKNVGDNETQAQKQAEELRVQTSRDRTDFLAARTYFWNNTIGIQQLEKAVNDINNSLGQQK